MPIANPEGHIPAERQWVFLVLLPGIALTFLASPIADPHGSVVRHAVVYSFSSLCIFAAIWAYSPHRRTIWVGVLLLLVNWVCRLIGAVWLFDGNAFALPAPEAGPTPLVYFSFVTMTTLGYGDIAPRSGLAQALASLQALVGQVFLAVFVAHLVSLNIVRRTEDTRE